IERDYNKQELIARQLITAKAAKRFHKQLEALSQSAYSDPVKAAVQKEVFNNPRTKGVWRRLKVLGSRWGKLSESDLLEYQVLYKEYNARMRCIQFKLMHDRGAAHNNHFRYQIDKMGSELRGHYLAAKAILNGGSITPSAYRRLDRAFNKLGRMAYAAALMKAKAQGKISHYNESPVLKREYKYLIDVGMGKVDGKDYEAVRARFIKRLNYLDKLDSLIIHARGAQGYHKNIHPLFLLTRGSGERSVGIKKRLGQISGQLEWLRSKALVERELTDVSDLKGIKDDPALKAAVKDIFAYNKVLQKTAEAGMFGIAVGIVAASGGAAGVAGGFVAGIFGTKLALLGTAAGFATNVVVFTATSRLLNKLILEQTPEHPFWVDLGINTVMLGGLAVVGRGVRAGMQLGRYGKQGAGLAKQAEKGIQLSRRHLDLLKEYKIFSNVAATAGEIGYLTLFSQLSGSGNSIQEDVKHNLAFIFGLRLANALMRTKAAQKFTQKAAKVVRNKLTQQGQRIEVWAHTPTERVPIMGANSALMIVARVTANLSVRVAKGTIRMLSGRVPESKIPVTGENGTTIRILGSKDELIVYKEGDKICVAKEVAKGEYDVLSLKNGEKGIIEIDGKKHLVTREGEKINLNSNSEAIAAAEAPPVPKSPPKNETKPISELASSRSTYGDKNNKDLYKTAVEESGVKKGGTAVEVGACSNMRPAKGLIEAGVDRVIRVDKFEFGDANQKESYRRDRREMGYQAEGKVTDKIENRAGDATNLPQKNGTARVVVFNQSLYFVGLHARKTHMYKADPSLKGKSDAEVGRAAQKKALSEAHRKLEENGRVLIKTGNHRIEGRAKEGPVLEALLGEVGFKDIKVVRSSDGTPVFISARKASSRPAKKGADQPVKKRVPKAKSDSALGKARKKLGIWAHSPTARPPIFGANDGFIAVARAAGNLAVRLAKAVTRRVIPKGYNEVVDASGSSEIKFEYNGREFIAYRDGNRIVVAVKAQKGEFYEIALKNKEQGIFDVGGLKLRIQRKGDEIYLLRELVDNTETANNRFAECPQAKETNLKLVNAKRKQFKVETNIDKNGAKFKFEGEEFVAYIERGVIRVAVKKGSGQFCEVDLLDGQVGRIKINGKKILVKRAGNEIIVRRGQSGRASKGDLVVLNRENPTHKVKLAKGGTCTIDAEGRTLKLEAGRRKSYTLTDQKTGEVYSLEGKRSSITIGNLEVLRRGSIVTIRIKPKAKVRKRGKGHEETAFDRHQGPVRVINTASGSSARSAFLGSREGVEIHSMIKTITSRPSLRKYYGPLLDTAIVLYQHRVPGLKALFKKLQGISSHSDLEGEMTEVLSMARAIRHGLTVKEHAKIKFPVEYWPVQITKNESSGKYVIDLGINNKGKKFTSPLEADVQLEGEIIVESKKAFGSTWLQTGRVPSGKSKSAEVARDRIGTFINQCRKYGRALANNQIKGVVYHITAPRISRKALDVMRAAIPKGHRHKVRIYLFSSQADQTGTLLQ
ncbi:MAG: hypothetical protein HQ564_08280, partial [Candidatus Saganbacteria bacterium]|nr:hypothetical protein [Candidatus Saganbacteria bacterium]